MNFGWLNIEHMGALIQDESGTWNFFYWGGDSVVLEPIKDSSALNSMDELNEYLNSHIADKSLNRIIYTEEDKVLLNEKAGAPYITSVYIRGDFTESLKQATALRDNYDNTGKFSIDANREYSLFNVGDKKNCGTVTTELAMMGKLPDGTTVKDYVNAKSKEEKKIRNVANDIFNNTFLGRTWGWKFNTDYRNRLIPDSNLNKFQDYFGNKGFTEDDFWKAYSNFSEEDKAHFTCRD